MDSSSEMEKHKPKNAYLNSALITKLTGWTWEGNRMHTAVKMQKTASTSVLEIYGGTVKNCKKTKIKNTYLRHHTTVKLEIDRMDLSGWEEKSQEWRMQAWRSKPYLSCGRRPWHLCHSWNLQIFHPPSSLRRRYVGTLQWLAWDGWVLKVLSYRQWSWRRWGRNADSKDGGTTEDAARRRKGLPVDGPRWWQVSSRWGFLFLQCTSLHIQTSHHKPSPIPRSRDVDMSQRGKIVLEVAWFLEF